MKSTRVALGLALCVLIFAFCTHKAHADITTGLVGWWRMDEGSGATTTDSSGNGNTGTLVNSPTWATGKINGALKFNGSNQYVAATSTHNLPNINGAQTLSAWFDATSVSGSHDIITFVNSTSSPSLANQLRQVNNYLDVSQWGGGDTIASTSITFNANTWHMATFTWNGASSTLYLDGQQINQNTVSPQSGTGAAVYIGEYPTGEQFAGMIDDVRIYNRALSAADVQQLYQYQAIGGPADEMLSANYGIQEDSINNGGNYSSSASYQMQDTTGETATGFSSSTNYILSAGYQQMQTVAMSVVPPAPVVMSPDIGGVSGGTGNGSTTMIITTDDAAGYQATIQASSSPALVDTSSTTNAFADYSPSGSAPDFTFLTTSTTSIFGFSSQGTDADQRFLNNSSACNTGSNSTAQTCWDGLSTSPKNVADRTTDNQPAGTQTTLWFRAYSGPSHIQVSGTYVATTTLTVLPL